MPTASARGVETYIRLGGRCRALDFQKIKIEEWLDKNLKDVPLSDNR